MRSYPGNSPQAAARVVALTALADGHISASELGVLDRLNASARLGLPPAQLLEVVQHLTEDLMATAYSHWGTACQLDDSLLHSLMQEITDPQLRRTTFELCVAVARADFYMSGPEENFIAAAARRWLLDPDQPDFMTPTQSNPAKAHHAR